MKKLVYITLFLAVIVVSALFLFRQFRSETVEIEAVNEVVEVIPEPQDRVEKIDIPQGSTYADLMTSTSTGLTYSEAMEIYDASKEVYDLVKIRVGRILELVYDKDSDELKEVRYKIDTEDELFVINTEMISTSTEIATTTSESVWKAEIKPIPYEVRVVTAEGTVETSMYEAASSSDIDIRAIIELADVFQWTIDFAMDPRVGDTFKFVYEQRYLDGQYVMPGKIFAGYYVNDGTRFDLYYFEESDENKGFFDGEGNSVQRMFLKAPVSFRYISSGYTTGPRYVGGQYQTYTANHMAIDYAADSGTPIRAVGDGIIAFAGWKSGYGNFTSVRHNGTYTTNYGHQSKFAAKTGQRVKQGDIIGYVGSTGFSTGPHLHYEMVKDGVKVNPLKEVMPPGEKIKEENMARFNSEIQAWKDKLDS